MAATASTWLKAQTSRAYPDVDIGTKVAPLDERLRFPACEAIEFSLPGGSRLWGRGSLGIRCSAPKPWSLYLNFEQTLRGPALIARRPLEINQTLNETDLDLRQIQYDHAPTQYPGTIAPGVQLQRRLAAGQAVTLDALVMPEVIKAGQNVILHAQGNGFKVTQEGKALASARAGERVRVKTSSGRIINGTATQDGQVQVTP